MALRASRDVDGRAAGKPAGRIGIGGPGPDPSRRNVDAVLGRIDLVLDQHPLAAGERRAVDGLQAGEPDIHRGGHGSVGQSVGRGPGGGTGGGGEEICKVQGGRADLHHIAGQRKSRATVGCATGLDEDERTGRQLGRGVGVAGPLPGAGTDEIDAVLGGVGLVLHKYAVAGDNRHAVDRGRGTAQRDVAIGEGAIGRGRRGLDLVIRTGSRYGGELEAGLAEDGGGGIEECPAASLGAPADEDGEARRQLNRGVGIRGPRERAAPGRVIHVDAVIRRGSLILKQHTVARGECYAVEGGRASQGDILDGGHPHGLLHCPARTRQGAGCGAAGSRDEVDIAGSAGSHTTSKRQRRGVERDGAIGGGDVTEYRQRSGGSQSDIARRADRAAHDRHVATGLDGDRPARGSDGIHRQGGLLVDGDRVAVGNGGGVDARVEPEIGHTGLQVNRAAGGLAKRHCHRGARDQAGGNARGGRLRHEVVLGGRARSAEQVGLRGSRDRSGKIDVGILGVDDHRARRGNTSGGPHPHLAGLGRRALQVDAHVDGGERGIDRQVGEIGGG